ARRRLAAPAPRPPAARVLPPAAPVFLPRVAVAFFARAAADVLARVAVAFFAGLVAAALAPRVLTFAPRALALAPRCTLGVAAPSPARARSPARRHCASRASRSRFGISGVNVRSMRTWLASASMLGHTPAASPARKNAPSAVVSRSAG